jgi:DNA-binding NarL/FixJ family response regulator
LSTEQSKVASARSGSAGRDEMVVDRQRVLLVDDHPLMRASVTATLTDRGYEVATFGTATEAHDWFRRLEPELHIDAALVDLELPDKPGLWLIRELAAADPDLPIAAFSGSTSEKMILEALDGGASGFISKQAAPDVLCDKLAMLISGGEAFDELSASKLINALRKPRTRSGKLTSREVGILEMLANGADTQAIATKMILSPFTVKDSVRQIFKKLGVHDRAAAVAEGFRIGVLR